MSALPPDDPWDWPVSTVVQYLCSSPGILFPNFDHCLKSGELASRIENNDLRGEFLLELDDASVKEYLGISSFGLIVTFRRIIQTLRQQSQKWQLQNTQRSYSGQSFLETETAATATEHNQQNLSNSSVTAGPADTSGALQDDETKRPSIAGESRNKEPRRAALIPATVEPVPNDFPINNTANDEFDYLLHWQDISDDEVLPSLGHSVTTEDNSEADEEAEDDEESEDNLSDESTEEEDQESDIDDGDDSDSQGNEVSDDMDIDQTNGIPLPIEVSSRKQNEGASSTEESADEDEELTPKEARIRDAEHEQLARWKAKKLPKLELKAYQIWTAARNKTACRESEEHELERLQHRLSKLENTLIDTATESELDKLVEHLEATIHDIAATEWKIELLSRDVAPEKPANNPTSHKPNTKKRRRVNKELDEEDLISDDDETNSDDNFIVNNEDDQSSVAPRKSTKTPTTDTENITSPSVKAPSKPLVDQVDADATESDENCSNNAAKKDGETQEVHLPPFWDVGAWRRRLSNRWANHLIERRKQRHFLAWNIARPSSGWGRANWFIRNTPLDRTPWNKLRSALRHLLENDDPLHRSVEGEEPQVSRAMCQIAVWFICWETMVVVSLDEVDSNQLEKAYASAQGSAKRSFVTFWETLRQIDAHWDKSSDTDASPQTKEIVKPVSETSSRTSRIREEQPRLSSTEAPRSPLVQSPILKLRRLSIGMTPSDDEPLIRGGRVKRKVQESISSDSEHYLQRRGNKKVKKDMQAESQRAQAVARMKQHINNAEMIQKPAADPGGMENVYVNPGARDEKDFIPINDSIQGYLKLNQRKGIAFMWREVVEAGEGALLAHTMGLGKTLQCITLLTTVAEAARIPKFEHLIPQTLRPMKVLVVAPAALIANWHDEFMKWTPRMHNGKFYLGDIHVMASHTPAETRFGILQHWYESKHNEVLLTSYQILSRMVIGKDYRETDREQIRDMLREGPDIVIADEAQYLKSTKTKVSGAMAGFSTPRRIALTGSPLSNNLEEYFALINWACKGYLGPENEFRAIHANPIKHGLYNDSSQSDYRRALVKLKALERILEPKMDRAGWEDMVDMPQKTEFTIHLPASELQRQIYDTLVNMVADERSSDSAIVVMVHFNALKILAFHPDCFKQKLITDQGLLQKLSAQQVPEKMPPALQRLQTQDEVSSETTTSTRTPTPVQDLTLEDDTNQQDTLDVLDNDPKDPFLSLERIQTFLQFFENAYSPESSKLSMVCKIIQHCGDEKVLVFSHSLIVLDFIESKLRSQDVRCKRIDGSSGTVHKRQEIVKAFNENPNFAKVMLVSTKAGGVGLNLYAASRVIICDESWNPTNERQAIGRAYRLGQQKHVFVYRLMLSGSYEEALQNQTVFKEQLASRVVEKKAPARYAKKDIGKFLRPLAIKSQTPLDEFFGKDPEVLDKIFDNENIIRIQMGEEFTRERHEPLTVAEQGEVDMILDMRKHGKKAAPLFLGDVAPTQGQTGVLPSTMAMNVSNRMFAAGPNMSMETSFPGHSFNLLHNSSNAQHSTSPITSGYFAQSNQGFGSLSNSRFLGPRLPFVSPNQVSKSNLNTGSILNSAFMPQPGLQHPVPYGQNSAPASMLAHKPQEPEVIDLLHLDTTSEEDVVKKPSRTIEQGSGIPSKNRAVSLSSDSGVDVRHPQSQHPRQRQRDRAHWEARNQPVNIRQRSMQSRNGNNPDINKP